jgi:NTE family protein
MLPRRADAAKVGGRIGSDPLPRYDQFQWGGFLQLTGLRTGQLGRPF